MIKIALVGRPNVGKSALFNRILGQRISIVDECEGVTRDRIYGQTELFGTFFTLIDTGGLALDSALPLPTLIKEQTLHAIEEADALILVVDGQIGVTQLDLSVARLLLPLNRPLCVAVNKVDHSEQEWRLAPFYQLGIPSVTGVSAAHGLQIVELLEQVLSPLTSSPPSYPMDDPLRVAIIGRTNVGKSTLLNFLLKEQRSLVSEQAGTTRDAIDAFSTAEGTTFQWIDTAGIRRKKAERNVVEKYAAIRTQEAIKRAHLCLLMLDAQSGLTTQEKRMLSLIESEGKGCLLFFNKWDLVKGYRTEHCMQAMQKQAPFTAYCPCIFGSAKTGQHLQHLFPLLKKISSQRTLRISTGQLNQCIAKAIQKTPPPMITGQRLRIYYLTQVATAPPRFLLFVNFPKLLTATYQKYLINQLRKEYHFTGTPLFFHVKQKPLAKKSSPSKPSPPLQLDQILIEKAPQITATP